MQRKKRVLTPFGKAVWKKTINKNMTLTQIAKQAGTSSSYLNSIIHGERSGEKYIGKIAEILNIDASKYIS